MNWPFVPGLRLSEAFFTQAIEPALTRIAPDLRYAAARIDYGSDVLGFDTPTSMDHGWGPRVMLFLSKPDHRERAADLSRQLGHELPFEILGVPTNFESESIVNGGLRAIEQGPVQHGVAFATVTGFFEEYLGFDPVGAIPARDWLTAPSQRLRTILYGRIFRDPDGELAARRSNLRWYPPQLWLYLLASQWRRIGQEEAFMARAADVGDDLGSRIIATRLTVELMRLVFLLEKEYPPYFKWFGTAFRQLEIASRLGPALEAALRARDWPARERHLGRAYRMVAAAQNMLALAPPVDPTLRRFHERPYTVIDADRFAEALESRITDHALAHLPKGVGAVWQFADSTDVLDAIERSRSLRAAYDEPRHGSAAE